MVAGLRNGMSAGSWYNGGSLVAEIRWECGGARSPPRPPPRSLALPRSGVPPMTRAATARWTTAPALVLLALTALDPAPARGDGFDQNVRPLLQQHCLRCHGGEKPKGDVNLAKFADEESLRGDPDLWLRVVDALVERTMPPPGNRAGPNVDDRQHAADSIKAILDAVEGVQRPRAQPDPAADPPAIQQHDPRPARRRHPPGRRLPRRRRRRRRVRQQRLDPVRPADPHGEVPGGGRRRAR